MFMPQSRTRKDGSCQSRLADVDGYPGGDQFAVAGFQRKRSIQAGSQVQTGRAGGGIFGQREFASNTLIQNLDFDRVSRGIGGD